MADSVAPIPPEYAGAVPYMVVPNVAKALSFYTRAFGATEMLRLLGPGGGVIHAEMRIGSAPIMLGRPFPEMGAHPAAHYGGSPITVAIYVVDVDTFVKRAVAAGCKVLRPVTDQFYGDRGGALEDPFGLRWMFNTHIEDVDQATMQARVKELFGGA